MKDSTALKRVADILTTCGDTRVTGPLLTKLILMLGYADRKEHEDRGLIRCEACSKWTDMEKARSDGECDFCPTCWKELAADASKERKDD